MPSTAPRPTFQDVNEWPQLDRPAARNEVLSALRFIHEGLPADQSIAQTARYLSLTLRGHVYPTDLQETYDLWLIYVRINRGDDLTFLLDVPNTETQRALELSVASGNLEASINDILTMAGVSK
jgi:hypothetical protein